MGLREWAEGSQVRKDVEKGRQRDRTSQRGSRKTEGRHAQGEDESLKRGRRNEGKERKGEAKT